MQQNSVTFVTIINAIPDKNVFAGCRNSLEAKY